MALRLSDSVKSGRIDNRQRGMVTGEIWLLGRDEPVLLSLTGNCLRDLAGCLLEFTNPAPESGEPDDLAADQTGKVGDMTASRKVTVFGVSLDEARRLRRAGEPVPEHRANAVYLEWFSLRSGRVVVESADYEVSISPPEWQMTEEEEQQQMAANQQGMRDFLAPLTRMIEEGRHREDGDPGEDEDPMDEFGWERTLRHSDAVGEKHFELMDRYMDHPDGERIIAREMGWTWIEDMLDAQERGELPPPDADDDWGDCEEPEPDPETEGVDWIRLDHGHIEHPLTHKANELAMELWHYCDDSGKLTEDGADDLHEMLIEAQMLGAKLAGALSGLAQDRYVNGGFIVASLKRALRFFDSAIGAAAKVRQAGMLPAERLDRFTQGLFEVREEMLVLMERFRNEG